MKQKEEARAHGGCRTSKKKAYYKQSDLTEVQNVIIIINRPYESMQNRVMLTEQATLSPTLHSAVTTNYIGYENSINQ
jgi:hypothetical protein